VFQDNDIVLITNCFTSDIFEANTVARAGAITTIEHTLAAPATTPGNMNLPGVDCGSGTGHCLWGGTEMEEERNVEVGYSANSAAAYRLQTVTYSVAASATDPQIPALWREVNGNNEELIDGIERMNVLFGIDNNIADNDDSPDQYLNAATITNAQLEQVTAVRVFLVARSDDDFVLDGNQNYVYMGADQVGADRRLRQVFTSTIDLRNR
jgi:type IV pilus assembly protein PilW